MAGPTTRTYGGGSALLFGVIVVAILILGYMFMRAEPQTTDANPIPSTSGEANSPASSKMQPQPQGNPGTITTEGEGASPHNPQGGTPSNMQVKPEDSTAQGGTAK